MEVQRHFSCPVTREEVDCALTVDPLTDQVMDVADCSGMPRDGCEKECVGMINCAVWADMAGD